MGKLEKVALAVLVGSYWTGAGIAAFEFFPTSIRSGRDSHSISVPELIEHYRSGFSDVESSRLARLLPLVGTGLTVRVLETVAQLVHRDTWQSPEEYQRFELLLLARLVSRSAIMQEMDENALVDFLIRTVDRVRANTDFTTQFDEQEMRIGERRLALHAATLERIRLSSPPWVSTLPGNLLLMTIDPGASGRSQVHQFINLALRIRDIHEENVVTDFLRTEGAELPAWSNAERYLLVANAYEHAAEILDRILADNNDLDLLIEAVQVRLWALNARRLGRLEPDYRDVETVRRYLQRAQIALDTLRGPGTDARLLLSIMPQSARVQIEARYRELLLRSEIPLQILLARLRVGRGTTLPEEEEGVKTGFRNNLLRQILANHHDNIAERLDLYQRTIDRFTDTD